MITEQTASAKRTQPEGGKHRSPTVRALRGSDAPPLKGKTADWIERHTKIAVVLVGIIGATGGAVATYYTGLAGKTDTSEHATLAEKVHQLSKESVPRDEVAHALAGIEKALATHGRRIRAVEQESAVNGRRFEEIIERFDRMERRSR